MCGRFTSAAESSQVAERFGAAVPDGYRRRWNAAPAQQVLAIVRDGEERRAELMRWGLVPHWAKDLSVSYKLINARAETILEKPAYRALVGSHRCLVPADGFYEWRVGPDGKKEPVHFALRELELFAFAGLWTRWADRATGELVDSCTIVTTAANGLVAPVHDRMPVILPPGGEALWLDPEAPPELAVSLLVPYPAELMRAVPASRRVGSVANEGPELLVADTPAE